MNLFYVTRQVDLEVNSLGANWSFHLRPPGCGPIEDNLYFCTGMELTILGDALSQRAGLDALKVLNTESTLNIAKQLIAPNLFGKIRSIPMAGVALEEQLHVLRLKNPARIAIVTPFGFRYGDTILFLTALRELVARIRREQVNVEIDLLQSTNHPDVHALYMETGFFKRAVNVPLPLSVLLNYDGYFIFSMEYVREDIPWVDGLLEAMAIDPTQVPPERKRNRLCVDPKVQWELEPVVAEAKADGLPLVLFHPLASTSIRSFPPQCISWFLDSIFSRRNWKIAATVPVPYSHPRFLDWSATAQPFSRFVYLISQMDAFISVDTSTFHIADAFDIPGLVFFTTQHPQRFLTYYPRIKGVEMEAGNRLSGRHNSEKPEDIAYAHSLWHKLEVKEITDFIDCAIAMNDLTKSKLLSNVY
jgi:hypothetical protein